MKSLSSVVLAITLFCNGAYAQYRVYYKLNHFNITGEDNLKLSFNDHFEITPDGCGQLTRYAHFDAGHRKFVGEFKDVSSIDSNIVLTQGAYNEAGEKNGAFITRYANGKLQAKGNFVNGDFDGRWEMYYENGKPKLVFTAHQGHDIAVTDYWDDSGKKLIDHGKGKYIVVSDKYYWVGHLLNGKPNGKWRFCNAGDDSEIRTGKYKNGVFQTDKSHHNDPQLRLVSVDMLPFVKAEKLNISQTGCLPPADDHIQYAYYQGGNDGFVHALNFMMAQTMRHYDISRMASGFYIEGEVNDQGFLTHLQSYDAYDPQLANAIISTLKAAPRLVPAMIGDNKVNQKIRFNFSFGDNRYYFSYHFGEIIDRSRLIAGTK